MNEDVDGFNRDQRIRRLAFAAALDELGYIAMGSPRDRAAARYPLRKRVAKIIEDPHGAGEWSTEMDEPQGMRAVHRFSASSRFSAVASHLLLSPERVAAIQRMFSDPWAWEDDPSVEEGT